MKVRRTRQLTLALICLSLLPGAQAAADNPGLDVVEPDSIAATLDGKTTKPTSVWVRNTTKADVTPAFAAIVENSDHKAVNYGAYAVDDAGTRTRPSPLSPGQVSRYRVVFRTPPRAEAEASGQLVVRGASSSAAVDLSIQEKAVTDVGVSGHLLWPIVPAFLIILVISLLVLPGKETQILTPLPASLNFSDSFASTLTAAGALLGTVLAAGVLPDDTTSLTKEGFAALNLTFGVGVAAAAIVYAAIQRLAWAPVEHHPSLEKREVHGTVLGFLIASFVTLWAVFGELLVTLAMLQELGSDQGFSDTATTLLTILIVVLMLAVTVYALVRAPATIRSQRKKSRRHRRRHTRRRDAEATEPVTKLELDELGAREADAPVALEPDPRPAISAL